MAEFCAQFHGPWRGARTPSSPPNIGDFVTPDGRTSDGRTERDTLKSTYVKQLPLFGKATEVAIIKLPFSYMMIYFLTPCQTRQKKKEKKEKFQKQKRT